MGMRFAHRFVVGTSIALVPICLLATIGTAAQSGTQGIDIPQDSVIRLERTSCFGPCPIYSVAIDATGLVTYDGEMFVRAVGRQTGRIQRSLVAQLLATAERIGFFEMRDAYREIENPDGTRTSVTDLPTTIVAITLHGRSKRVENYLGAPDSLAAFERDIDAAAQTKRWVFLDEATLEELLRSGWPASGAEGARLLEEAIERDELAIAQTLIQAGADLDGPPDNQLPPLLHARSPAMVELLVTAGADPNERPVGRVGARTPLMATDYKDAAVAGALLKAGARLEDTDEGKTALWWVACAGNWRVVEVLLRAGANPRGATGMSAAECTRRAREDRATIRRLPIDRGPTVKDFDQVIALLEAAERGTQR